jgi:hypothetical protein
VPGCTSAWWKGERVLEPLTDDDVVIKVCGGDQKKCYEKYWKTRWPANIGRGKWKMSDDAGKCGTGKEAAILDEDDPFDDIWVPSLYIQLKVDEMDRPLLAWEKAEAHRKENNLKPRPYTMCLKTGGAVAEETNTLKEETNTLKEETNTLKEDNILGKKRKIDVCQGEDEGDGCEAENNWLRHLYWKNY